MSRATFVACVFIGVSLLPRLGASESEGPDQPSGWSLPALWQLATDQSPKLARARANIAATEAGVKRARLRYLPRVSAQVSYQDYVKIASVLTFAEPEPYSIFKVGLEVSQTLYDGSATKHEVALARDQLKQSQLEYEQAAEELLWALTEHFFDAAAAQIESVGLAPIEALASERLEVFEKQLRAGVVDRLALFRTQGELERLQRSRLAAKLRKNLAEAQLTQLLRTTPDFWQTHASYQIPQEHAIAPESLARPPSAAVEIAELKLEMAERRWKKTASGYAPKIEAVASAGHLSRDELRFSERGTDTTLGVTLSWGVDTAMTARLDRLEARSQIEVAEAEYADVQQTHAARVHSTRLQWEQAQDTVALLQSSADRQKTRVEAVRSAASGGLYDRSMLLTEEQTLAQTQLDLRISLIELRRQQYLTLLLARHSLP
ncbi:MAG: hypothetical protein SynsKO_05380 [Synoicihabitans sp.]